MRIPPIKAHFDGKFIVPDEPVDLRPGEHLIVDVIPLPDPSDDEPAWLWSARNAISAPELPRDLSRHHDHYRYGKPKNED